MSDCSLRGLVDVLKLRVAIGMACSFKCFPVCLAAIAKLAQQTANQLLADYITQFFECLDDVALAAAHPAQRCLRIAPDGSVHQCFDGLQQSGLAGFRPPPPSAGAAYPGLFLMTGLQLRNAAIDCTARNPCCR